MTTEPSHTNRLARLSERRIGAFHKACRDTELAAAVGQYAKAGSDRRRVLDFIASCGPFGATDSEIADGTGIWLYTAAPRRRDLVELGLVEPADACRTTPRGGRARVWKVVEP